MSKTASNFSKRGVDSHFDCCSISAIYYMLWLPGANTPGVPKLGQMRNAALKDGLGWF